MLAAARELADTVEVFMAGDGDDFAEELGEHGAETVYSTGDLDGGLQELPLPQPSLTPSRKATSTLLMRSCWAPPRTGAMSPLVCR